MKFPLERIGKMDDLINAKDGDFPWHAGRIYLIEINSLVKVGRSRWLSRRAKQHLFFAKSYGMPVGACAYSLPLNNIVLVEAEFHRQLAGFKRDGCKELFSGSLDDLMPIFDLDCTFATPIDREAQRLEMLEEHRQREAKKARRRELKEFRIAFQNQGSQK